ncbi:MAG: antitoxin YezG family protein [Gammaproteobacteria bacterium]|nr:antitoxin YezG family protein [Gammaproteobacteria bacterium]MBU2206135.1 antitoxin YezG family protein [Gammaproteobacteria bacterium]
MMKFTDIDEIYNVIGQEMFDSLPEKWDRATLEVNLDSLDIAITIGAKFSFNGTESAFNLYKRNGKIYSSGIGEAFFSLYKIMRKNEQDVPWNKARFEITSEGDFTIDFKYDEDFAYLNSLDPDNDRYPSSDEILAIESWQGLAEDYPRYWKKH